MRISVQSWWFGSENGRDANPVWNSLSHGCNMLYHLGDSGSSQCLNLFPYLKTQPEIVLPVVSRCSSEHMKRRMFIHKMLTWRKTNLSGLLPRGAQLTTLSFPEQVFTLTLTHSHSHSTLNSSHMIDSHSHLPNSHSLSCIQSENTVNSAYHKIKE